MNRRKIRKIVDIKIKVIFILFSAELTKVIECPKFETLSGKKRIIIKVTYVK